MELVQKGVDPMETVPHAATGKYTEIGNWEIEYNCDLILITIAFSCYKVKGLHWSKWV